MKNTLIATVAVAAMVGVASGEIVNGDFSDGANGWTQYGGSKGPYGDFVSGGSPFDNGAMAVVAYGTFGGTPNYSGYTQNISGSYAAGDVINFGGQMYIEDGKDLFGENNASIQITFWYGDGTAYGFNTVAGTLTSSSETMNVYTVDADYTITEDNMNGLARISLDFSYVQNSIPDSPSDESGAVWATNMYANIVPAPGALALLGVAGLAGRRRRG